MQKTTFLLLIAFFAASAPVRAVTFDPSVRYSRLVIDASLYHFHANTSKVAGFARYDADGNLLAASESNRGFDYVPGLVAKAVLEAVDLYQDSTFAAPWFYSIRAYGDKYAGDSRSGGSLDNLNACKLYFGLADLTAAGAKFADAARCSSYKAAQSKALAGLEDHHTGCSISTETSVGFCGADTYAGGWWHKSNYKNEMWCDGQYMGPALLAQLLAEGYTFQSLSADESWSLVAKQFTMTWSKLWDSEKQLLWHAFTATPAATQTSGWADQDAASPHYGVSAEYWGRAAGWYFLALVDVLELMPAAHPDYAVLRSCLNSIAGGLAVRQDAGSGCWCQLLQYGNGTVPAGCTKANYLESSATAIFTAAYLKGQRLGLFDDDWSAVAKKAYQGMVEQFLVTKTGADDDNPYSLVDCCASAGLSSDRDGTAAYYLEGSDTKHITNYTEGKVLGAFILAAVEYERAYMPLVPDVPESDCQCLSVTLIPNE